MAHVPRTRQFHSAAAASLLSVLAVLATAGLFVLGLPSAPASAQTQGTGSGFLSTDGSRIVDATGQEVRLTGINWFGMETDNHTFHGLWANAPATWTGQLDRMAELGFNTLRIPYTGDSLRPDAEASSVNAYTNPDLAVRGVIATMFDPRTNLAREVVEAIPTSYGLAVLDPPVPKTVKVAEAPSHGCTVLQHAPSSKGARAYRELAAAIHA